jgi:hypothetical protein
MFFTINFPLIDLRPVLKNTWKLYTPAWPTPNAYNSFIKNFGSVRERLKGGDSFWGAEDKYCNAEGILKLKRSSGTFNIKPVYKRFYSDGHFMSKIEIGLKDNVGLSFEESNDKLELENLLLQYCFLRIIIKSSNYKKTETFLFNAGSYLAKSYAVSSTNSNKITAQTYRNVIPGQPIIIAIYDSIKQIVLPHYSKLIFDNFCQSKFSNGITLHHIKLNDQPFPIKAWLIGIPKRLSANENKDFKSEIRNLRMNLSRIHIEKETIRILLNSIRNTSISLTPNSEESETIQWYLKKTSEKLFKAERYNIPQKNILKMALESDFMINEGISKTLTEEMNFFENKYLRKNIQQLINFYNMGHITNITGNNNQVINDSTIENSFNNIEKNHGKDLSNAIKLLQDHVKRTNNQEAMESVKSLAEEAEKKEPKKSIIKALWNGIVSLVPTVKEITVIAENIGKLISPHSS